jgi:adenylate cyclase
MGIDQSGQKGRAREAGANAVGAVRRLLARKAADLIRHDSDAAGMALEMGLIDQRWLDNPGEAPLSTVGPTEVVERFLERAVEQRPSRLSSLGLGAAQLLSSRLAVPSTGRVEEVTVVFTDLEGFTSYTAENGDEAAVALLQEHYRHAGPVVRRQGGRIVKRLGDGLLCTFPDAASGLGAAIELVGAPPHPLALRAGVHRGEVIASPDDVIGHVVNIAARVAEIARGGQALATVDAVTAAGPVSGLHVGRARSRRLKGITERVSVADISAAGTSA